MNDKMTKWSDREPMRDAYCSYEDCENTTIYPQVYAGGKCQLCGKPLSWVGDKCIRMPLGKITKGKDKK